MVMTIVAAMKAIATEVLAAAAEVVTAVAKARS